MQYTFSILENTLSVSHLGKPLFGGMYLSVTTQRGGVCEVYPKEITVEGNVTTVTFSECDRLASATLRFCEVDNVLQCSMEAATAIASLGSRMSYLFASNDAIKLHFAFARKEDGNYITDCSTKLWFQTPSFSRDLTALPDQTQDIHIRSDEDHIHILPLVGDDLRTEFKGDALVASVGCSGVSHVSGPIMTLAVGSDPYEVIKDNFEAGRKTGAIGVPLRRERTLDPMFDGFGWCTWDAFYQDVTSEKIFQKLDQLKALGVKLRFVLIDDGWSQVKDYKLWAFEEDRSKFPEGLATCIKRIKEDYDIPYVGVWQAFGGYWNGVDRDGPIYAELGDVLTTTPIGYTVVSPDADKSFAFWDRWHSYLAAQGVDFVKVDNQATYSYHIDEVCKNVEGVRNAHVGLERSVFKHFEGRLINCMGMPISDLLTRPMSALNRNSNDFLPKLENGFAIHIRTNVYNAPVHSQVMYCDYDMWWSCHETAKPSSVLRAISGGPVYISDPIDATDMTYLSPLYEEDGSVPKLDLQAMPTYDCFYVDCEKDGVPLKVFNRSGDSFALAAFGLSDTGATGEWKLSDIPGAKGSYLACEYFSGKKTVMDADTVIPVSLAKHEVLLWNLYPIQNGEVLVGDTSVYMGCASKKKTAIKL